MGWFSFHTRPALSQCLFSFVFALWDVWFSLGEGELFDTVTFRGGLLFWVPVFASCRGPYVLLHWISGSEMR